MDLAFASSICEDICECVTAYITPFYLQQPTCADEKQLRGTKSRRMHGRPASAPFKGLNICKAFMMLFTSALSVLLMRGDKQPLMQSVRKSDPVRSAAAR